MSFRIIGDSCTDLTDELKQDENVSLAPLYIHIGEHTVIDDATFDQADFLKRVSEYPEAAKSSCPSPQAYMDLFDEKKDNYVITLSSQLSGSYNSAELAKKQFHEDYPNTNIEVFDSKSASVGQTLIARKIKEHALQGDTFHEVVEKVNAYRDAMTTKFVLESLETLRKNGRLSNIKAIICSALNIKPIMTSTDEGEIDKLDQARGIKKALLKMIEVVVNEIKDPENCVLGISHCNNKERAIFVKDEILKYIKLKEVLIVDTAGISSLYANDGGIIVCY